MSDSLLGALIWLAILAVIGYFIFRWLRKRRVERTGSVVLGTVASVDMTHEQINNMPVMKITFDYPQANGETHRAHLRTTIPPGTSIDVGDGCALVVDPSDPDRIYLADDKARQRGRAAGAIPAKPAAGSVNLAGVNITLNGAPIDPAKAQQMSASIMANLPKGMQSLMQQAMVQQQQAATALGDMPGKIAVGDVVAIRPQDNGIVSVQVDVVRIGKPRQTIFCTQPFPEGVYFETGDRVFLRLDQNDPPRAGFIEPLSFSKGQRIPRTGNRTDAIVLADDLLFAGSKAQGTILSSTEQPLPPEFAKAGASKWQMHFRIVPEDGTPAYEGDCSVSVSNPQKAAAVNKPGLVVPLRYDPADLATFTIDSIGLGWGDPRLAREQAAKIILQAEHDIPS